MVNWLPNFKETLDNAFRDYVKAPLENKTNELNNTVELKAAEFEGKIDQIAQEFKANTKNFQHAIIAILFASFCLGIIAITFKETSYD